MTKTRLRSVPSEWKVQTRIRPGYEGRLCLLLYVGANCLRQVSLLLNKLPQFENEPKEYNLSLPPVEKVRSRRPGQAMVFSEKDLAGYKARTFTWDDLDEDGNPGQGRSYLYENHKRQIKKKENKGRYTPYARRPIPKQTAIAGTVAKEFEAIPVKNDEYFVLENKQAAELLKIPNREQAIFATGDQDPSRKHLPFMTQTDKANALKVINPTNSSLLLLTNVTIRMHRPGDKHRKRHGQRAWRSTCSSTNCWSCSGSTASGVSAISRQKSTNRRRTYDRH
jgi:hypothetical protein